MGVSACALALPLFFLPSLALHLSPVFSLLLSLFPPSSSPSPSPCLPPSLPHSCLFSHVGSLTLSSSSPILPLRTQEEDMAVTRPVPQISTLRQRLASHAHLVPSGLSCGQGLSVAIGSASQGPGLFLTSPGGSCNCDSRESENP